VSAAGQSSAAQTASGWTKARAVIVYTLLRVALFAAVWAVLQYLTPVHGLLAVVAAILMSGAISVVLLDRPRGEVGTLAAGFFGRINARIDASARAEDIDDEPAPVQAVEQPSGSGDAEHQAEREAVDQQ
jgi:hypothetical protein